MLRCFLGALLASAACAQLYETRFKNVYWDDYNWRIQTLVSDQGHYQGRANLANGYIGISVASLGPFFEADSKVHGDRVNGWPLFDRRQTFATVAGFYNTQPKTASTNFEWLDQYGGESVISGIPHWAGLVPRCGHHTLDAYTDTSQITGYTSTFDYKSAVLSWKYTWTPPACPSFDVEYSMFVHKLSVNQAAVQLKITPSRDVNVTVVDVLDGDCALRTDYFDDGFDPYTATIYSAVSPENMGGVTAYVYSTLKGDKTVDFDTIELETNEHVTGGNSSSVAQSVVASLRTGHTTVIQKFVGIASSDAIAIPQLVARNASLSGSETGFSQMLRTHAEEWASIFPEDSVDRYQDPSTGKLPDDTNVIEQQILAVTNPFYILQQTVSKNAVVSSQSEFTIDQYSISVGGLGSDSYAGMVFWDADVWMQPGMVLAFPDAMIQVANYRAAKYGQALANVNTAFTSSQNQTSFSEESAIYSWTSSRFGNCTGTGPCFDYEYHINGDIALQLENYWFVTGDTETFQNSYFPIYNSIAQLYSDLLQYNDTTASYTISNATDPDEFANHVDNPLYTMILAKTILDRANSYRKQFGMGSKSRWKKQANGIEIATDPAAGIHLEYTGMPGDIEVKQADVVLIYDFLDYESPYLEADFNYYAGRQSLEGPAMTFGVFSIIAAANDKTGCAAFTYELYGSQPYVRAPWFQFSEQLLDNYNVNGGFHPAFPFLTGKGGANRVAPYGYLGVHLQQSSFRIDPVLPPQILNLAHRTMYWQGHAIKAVANQTHTTLKRLHRSLPNSNPKYAKADIPVTVGKSSKVHKLAFGASLTFANRRPHLSPTVAGNIAQCRPVTSLQSNLPGQFPLSAVDGAISTKWQPSSASDLSSMTVFLGDAGIVPVQGFEFDWAQAPPQSYSITFSNVSDPVSNADITRVVSDRNVDVSDPYDPSKAADIVAYKGNTTSVRLNKAVMGGKFATLSIKGNQGDDADSAPGATVAEWSIIMKGGKKL